MGSVSVIGRDAELAAVRALVTDSRLMSLTGAGGAGKTRLGRPRHQRCWTASSAARAMHCPNSLVIVAFPANSRLLR